MARSVAYEKVWGTGKLMGRMLAKRYDQPIIHRIG